VIYPMHPRTVNNIERFKLKIPAEIRAIEPIGYLEFLQLEANSKLIITDSGGLQEEACILKVPCVTVRDNTERPETITAGINILAGTNAEKILESAKAMAGDGKIWINPYGDGRVAEKILKIATGLIKKERRLVNRFKNKYIKIGGKILKRLRH